MSKSKSGIHIKPSKKGTFTAAAKKHGKGVQEFARQVLANKENYSPAMVKKANFARNAAKWKHEDGGYIEPLFTQSTMAKYGADIEPFVYNGYNDTRGNWKDPGLKKRWAAEAGMMMPKMQTGGDPRNANGDADGEMARGQIRAMHQYLDRLENAIGEEDNLEPWVNSKITLADDYLGTVADYLGYSEGGEEMEEGEEMKAGGGIPQRYKNMGFTRVGQKKAGSGKHKWKVLAKKGDQYKVVQGGWKGMQDFSQHGSEKRKDKFWSRMGGRNSAKAKDPFSPLYWHKRFGTWEAGGPVDEDYVEMGGVDSMTPLPGKFYPNGMDMYPLPGKAEAGATFFELGGVTSMTKPLAGQVDMDGNELQPLAGQFDNSMKDVTPLPGKAKAGKKMPKNKGFQALPGHVKAKILANMAAGGKMPVEYARARFEAAGNEDMLEDYGYAKAGGKLPQAIAEARFKAAGNEHLLPEYGYDKAKSGIHIKPENKGKFTETKKRTGKTTEELTHSKNPLTRKRAIFAQNAAKWKKGQDGISIIDDPMADVDINNQFRVENKLYEPTMAERAQQEEQARQDFITGGTGLAPDRTIGNFEQRMQDAYKNEPGYKKAFDKSLKKLDNKNRKVNAQALTLAGLSLIDSQIKEKQPKYYAQPYDTPYYNPYPSGTGSSAINMEHGGWIHESNAVEYPYESGLMFKAGGQMIKRADGSYSRRGLWDNIRANRGSGKKPTKEMLKQERKIKAKEAEYGAEVTGLYYPRGGEIMNVADISNPIARMGGSIRINYPDNQYEEGGELSLYDDTQGAQPISENPYTSQMVQFDGERHGERNDVGSEGIPINYQGTDVEVEDGETGFKDAKGNFQIFGNMKNPITGRKFKKDGEQIAKKENKAMNKRTKAAETINELDPDNPYDSLKMNSAMLQMKGAEHQLEGLATLREDFAALQQMKLDRAEKMGMDPMELEKKGMYGKMIKRMAYDGDTIETDPPTGNPLLDITLKRNNPIIQRYSKPGPQYQVGQSTSYSPLTLMPLGAPSYKTTPSAGVTSPAPITQYEDVILRPGAYAPLSLSSQPVGDPMSTNEAALAYGRNVASRFVPYGSPAPAAVPPPSSVNTNNKKKVVKGNRGENKNPYKQMEKPVPVDRPNMMTGITPTPPSMSQLNLGQPTTEKEGLQHPPYNMAPFGQRNIMESDTEAFDVSQIYPELFALATNTQEPVRAQKFIPRLKQPFQMSFQDQLNQIDDTFRAAEYNVRDNPAALAQVAAEKAKAKNNVLGQQFNVNLATNAQVYNENLGLMNQAQAMNLQGFDQQYVRQTQARANTKRRTFDAMSSIVDKTLKDKALNRQLKIYENLYDYRYDPNWAAKYRGPEASFEDIFFGNTKSPFATDKLTDEQKRYLEEYKTQTKSGRPGQFPETTSTSRVAKSTTTKKAGGSIIKQFKNNKY